MGVRLQGEGFKRNHHQAMASSGAAATSAGAQAIPAPRAGTETELPHIQDLAVTPGGLHFMGTTPGGTRIIYDRNTLMQYRSSPLSRTPPAGFPAIPGVTTKGVQEMIPEEDDEDLVETPLPTGLGSTEDDKDHDDD